MSIYEDFKMFVGMLAGILSVVFLFLILIVGIKYCINYLF